MYTLYYISNLTVIKGLFKRVNSVFAERLKLETPFVSALITCIRGFLFKGYSFNRSFLCRLRDDKRIEQEKQALSSPDNLHHNTWLKQRVMIFFATCEQLRGSRRLIVGTGNISTLNALHGQ